MSVLFRFSFFFAFVFLLTSCGKRPPLVSGLQVNSSLIDDDVIVNVQANLNLGNIRLPSVTLPVLHPQTFERIGQISMTNMSAAQNFMVIELNASAISGLQTSVIRLPNGGLAPLIGNNRAIEIPIQNKAKIYLSIGEGKLALGVTVAFSTLDVVGQKVGTTNFFPVFNLNQVYGAAGIYTSQSAGKNGFGLFADLSQVLPTQLVSKVDQGDQLILNYRENLPAAATEEKINKEIYKLHQRKQMLRLNH
jgi:hypothetical protein